MKSFYDYIRKSFIKEMADNLSTFRVKTQDITYQLIQNWCLVKWCDLNPDNDISKRMRNHWASELKSYIIRIAKSKVKCGRKDKVIKDILITEMELNDPVEIQDIIRDKFNEEGLSKYVNQIAEICSKHINEICNVLLYDKYKIEEYINGYLG